MPRRPSAREPAAGWRGRRTSPVGGCPSWRAASPDLPTGLAGARYFFGAVVLGLMLVEVCLWAAASKSNVRAKWLMHATVLHLPVLLGLLIYDKFTR